MFAGEENDEWKKTSCDDYFDFDWFDWCEQYRPH